MATPAIDTLRYARKLRDAGVPPDQGEAMADAIGSERVAQLATKDDLNIATARLSGSIRVLQWMIGFTLAFVVALVWRTFG